MKFFFGGCKSNTEVVKRLKPSNILLSYFDLGKTEKLLIRNWMAKVGYKPNIFLDSGAFVASVKKKEIDIKEYVSYIEENKDDIFVYNGIDIPKDTKGVLKNQKLLEIGKLKPVYTFYVDNDIKYLKEAVEKYEYIALGGMIPYMNDTKKLQKYLAECYDIIKPSETGIKVHGIGIANFNLMKKFSFYSVDSATWLTGARFGQVFFWHENGNKSEMRTVLKNDLKRYKNEIVKHGIDYDKVLKGKECSMEYNILSMIAFMKAEESINKYYKENGIDYWNKDKKTKKKSKRKNPAGFEKNKGKIVEIRQRPEVREKWLNTMKGNLFRFESGSQAKGLPLFCNNCYVKNKCKYSPFNKSSDYYNKEIAESDNPPQVYCAMRKEFSSFLKPDSFGLRDVKTVEEAKNRLMTIQMTRASTNLYFELLDGGVLDKAVTHLLEWIYERLANVPQMEVNIHQNILYQTSQEIRNKFSDHRRKELLDILEAEEAEIIEE